MVFYYSSPKGTKALPSLYSLEECSGCVCVPSVCCVYVVFSVGVLCVCVCAVQNKATDSHILWGWALVGDQTLFPSSRPFAPDHLSLSGGWCSLIHSTTSIISCVLGDMVGTEGLILPVGWPLVLVVVLFWAHCDVGMFFMLSHPGDILHHWRPS